MAERRKISGVNPWQRHNGDVRKDVRDMPEARSIPPTGPADHDRDGKFAQRMQCFNFITFG